MKIHNLIAIVIFLGICFSCTWFEKQSEYPQNLAEIQKADSLLQIKLDTLKMDEVLRLKESEYAYLFDRLNTYEKNGGKIQFGLKTYFVALPDTVYIFEEIQVMPKDSIRDLEPEFYFTITKDSEPDIVYGRMIEVKKLPINYEYD